MAADSTGDASEDDDELDLGDSMRVVDKAEVGELESLEVVGVEIFTAVVVLSGGKEGNVRSA